MSVFKWWTKHVRPTLINMNPVELKYYPFMISLNKCAGSCNVLSLKTCVSKEKKDINVKAFNMIPCQDEAKAMTGHISCDCKWKFNSASCNLNQKWNNKTYKCEYKNCHKSKKDYSWNRSTYTCEKSKYFKSVADPSLTECNEIIFVMDIVSTKKTNTIATNVTSTASINGHSKKVRNC